MLRLSRWVLREPVDDLTIYPMPASVRAGLHAELEPAKVSCYLFNALRRSQSFHAKPFTGGLFIDETARAYLNAVLADPIAAEKDAPFILSRVLLQLGILTQSDDDEEAAHWAALEAGLGDDPKISWIEITNRCDMTCSFCDRAEMRRKVADMSKEKLKLGLEQSRASGQKVVQLYGLGEPLLHPDLPELVRMAADAGLSPGFSCVPVVLTEALATALIDAGLRNIIFSIDSLDAETFRRIRGKKADLEKCIANIETFLEINAARGRPVQTTVRMISLNANDAERARYMAFWLERDVDIVYVRPFGVHQHFEDRRRRSYQSLMGDWTSRKLCTWPWHAAVATVDGQLHACCLRSSGPMAMGSWVDVPARETWRNQGYEELRRALKIGDFPPEHPCASCTHAFHRVKRELEEIHANIASIDELPAVGWEF